MNFLTGTDSTVSRDLDLLAEVTKAKLSCDKIYISVSKHDKLYSAGLDLESAKNKENREHQALDTICKTTVVGNEALVLENAANDPRFQNLTNVSNGGIVAYLGVPLRFNSSEAYGAVCAISNCVRSWEPKEMQFLQQLSGLVSSLVTNELQKSEMEVLYDNIRETDLVLMTLATEMSTLVSVHSAEGSLLFASLGLTRLTTEHHLADVVQNLIDRSSFVKGRQESMRDYRASASVGTTLRTRDGMVQNFEIELVFSNNGTYFLKWTPLEVATAH